MCEEITDNPLHPVTRGTRDEQLLQVYGPFLKNHKFINYSKLLPRDEDKPTDAGKDSDKDKSAAKEKDKQDKKIRRTKTRIPSSIPTAMRPSIATSLKTCAGT